MGMLPLWRVKSLVIQEMSTLWQNEIMQSVDFTYILVNMVYEPYFWVILFFVVGVPVLVGLSYWTSKKNNPPPYE